MYEIWSGLELMFTVTSFEMAQKYIECGYIVLMVGG